MVSVLYWVIRSSRRKRTRFGKKGDGLFLVRFVSSFRISFQAGFRHAAWRRSVRLGACPSLRGKQLVDRAYRESRQGEADMASNPNVPELIRRSIEFQINIEGPDRVTPPFFIGDVSQERWKSAEQAYTANGNVTSSTQW
jgi:hypothetical protein